MVEEFIYYYYECKEPILKIEFANVATTKVRSIIWCCKGTYKLIPSEAVANKLQQIKDNEKLPQLTRKKDVNVFHWDEGIDLDPKIAKILLGL